MHVSEGVYSSLQPYVASCRTLCTDPLRTIQRCVNGKVFTHAAQNGLECVWVVVRDENVIFHIGRMLLGVVLRYAPVSP